MEGFFLVWGALVGALAACAFYEYGAMTTYKQQLSIAYEQCNELRRALKASRHEYDRLDQDRSRLAWRVAKLMGNGAAALNGVEPHNVTQ